MTLLHHVRAAAGIGNEKATAATTPQRPRGCEHDFASALVRVYELPGAPVLRVCVPCLQQFARLDMAPDLPGELVRERRPSARMRLWSGMSTGRPSLRNQGQWREAHA